MNAGAGTDARALAEAIEAHDGPFTPFAQRAVLTKARARTQWVRDDSDTGAGSQEQHFERRRKTEDSRLVERTKQLLDALAPEIAELRNDVFGTTRPPFETIAQAANLVGGRNARSPSI